MVRSIAGTLLEVGRGEKDFDTIQTAIVSRRPEFSGRDRSGARLDAAESLLRLIKMLIYHIVLPEAWEKFKDQPFYEAESLESEGFIHCSYRNQLEEVLERYYKNAEKVLMLHISPAQLDSESDCRALRPAARFTRIFTGK